MIEPMDTGRLRDSLSVPTPRGNPHWLVDMLVSPNVDEIRLPVGISHCIPVERCGLMHFTETYYNRYHRVPGSLRWWYKIT